MSKLRYGTGLCVPLILLAVVCGNVGAQARAKHVVTLDDLLTVRGAIFPQELSPDGRTLAYSTNTESTAAEIEKLWLIGIAPGSTPRDLGKGVFPHWSPDGTKLAFYSDRSVPRAYQLWVFDVKAGRAEEVTHLPTGIDPDYRTALSLGPYWDALAYSWSPDGTQLVFTSQVDATRSFVGDSMHSTTSPMSDSAAAPLVLTTVTPAAWTLRDVFAHAFPPVSQWAFWETPNGNELTRHTTNQLFVVDLRHGTVRQLTSGAPGCYDPAWSPDGRQIACLSHDQPADGIGQPSNVHLITVRTGVHAALTTHASAKWELSWSPNGKYVAYETAEHLGARQALHIIPSTGGGPVDVTARLDRSVWGHVWAPDAKSAYVEVADGVNRAIERVDITTGEADVVGGQGSAVRGQVTVARNGTLAWSQDDPTSPFSLRVLRPGARSAAVLLDFNAQVGDWILGEQEAVRWTNGRGDTVDGVLIKPVGYEAGHRYPLIVDVYPVTSNNFKGSPMGGNQAWAGRGYAVFMPTSRAPHSWATPIKSEAYTQAGKGPSGWELNLDDVMSGVDALIRRGIVDPDRMCVYGFSNGGGVVANLVTRTDRFRCAVSVAAWGSDWIEPSILHTDPQYMTQYAGGTSLWDDPDTYVQLSPVYRVTRVKTPMLLAVGDEDGDFLLGTIAMFNGLRRAGDEITLLRYPNQRHGFTDTALKDFWARETAFFDKYLRPPRP